MRVLRQLLSYVCWTLAVVAGGLTGAAFAGGGFVCQSGHGSSCAPQTWMLVLGVLCTLGLGVSGALLHRPRVRPPQPRFPWELPK
jgi:hypothetical protein